MQAFNVTVTKLTSRTVQGPYGPTETWDPPNRVPITQKAYLDMVSSVEFSDSRRTMVETRYRLIFAPGALVSELSQGDKVELSTIPGRWQIYGYPEHHTIGLVHTEVTLIDWQG